jgi:predicted protein tyrosine phosphatase
MDQETPASAGKAAASPIGEAAWTAEFSWVMDDLAVGGRFPSGVAHRLAREHGVGAVIDVRVEERDAAEELHASGITFLHLPTEDERAVSPEMLDEGVAFAQRAAAGGKRLLIHCQHGIGRSALVALCIVVDRGYAPLDAVARAKDARERISPNPEQYEAWADWLRRRRPKLEVPTFEAFARVAYRHLHRTA